MPGLPPIHRLALAGAAAAALLAGAPAVAQSPTTVVATDRTDAREGTPDLKRVAASRLSGGGVRLALSLAEELTPADLLTEADGAGPPGSICVRMWTTSTPRTTAPDLLACVTAQADAKTLRATVTKEVPGRLPSTVGAATLTRPSDRSVALRLAPGLLGRATRLRFAAEATRPGCVRLSCVDLAPDLGAVKTLRLR